MGYAGPVTFGAAMRPYQRSFWGTPLAPNAALDPNSSAVVASLAVQAQPPNALPNINLDPRWTAEPYVLPAATPRTPVILDRGTAAMVQMAASGVPFPAGWAPNTQAGDNAYTVWLPDWVDPADSTIVGEYIELGNVSLQADGLHASAFGRAANCNMDTGGHYGNWTASGYDPQNPSDPNSTYEVAGEGVQGSGLPYMPGVISVADFQRGYIDHAVHIAVAHAAPGHVGAAQKDDGDDPSTLVKEGMHFRLAAGYTAGGVHWICEMLIAAAARYGIVVTDKTAYAGHPGNLAFRAAPSAAPFFGGLSGGTVLAGFPWSHLELLA